MAKASPPSARKDGLGALLRERARGQAGSELNDDTGVIDRDDVSDQSGDDEQPAWDRARPTEHVGETGDATTASTRIRTAARFG